MSVALAMVALAIGVGSSGCGSGGGSADPVAEAAELTSHLGGAHVSYDGSISFSALPEPITFRGGGFINFPSHEGKLALTFEGFPAGVAEQLHGASFQLTELLKHSSIYVTSPLFGDKLPGGARWVRLDLAKLGGALGLDPNSITGGDSDPSQYLQYLRSAGATVSVAGHEVLRGVPTTHYIASLDLLRAAEAQPHGDRGLLRAAMKKLIAEIGGRDIPVGVWVDAHHVVRKVSLDFAVAIAGQRLGLAIDAEYHDFGTTPTVAAPSSAEVFDVTGRTISALPGAAG